MHLIAHVGVSSRKSFKLFGREIIFEEYQQMWSRYLNVTDRRYTVASPRTKGTYGSESYEKTELGQDAAISVEEEAILCHHISHVPVTLTLSTPWMRAHLETVVCKFGRNRAICLVVEAICTKSLQTDGQTEDGRRAMVYRFFFHANGCILTKLCLFVTFPSLCPFRFLPLPNPQMAVSSLCEFRNSSQFTYR